MKKILFLLLLLPNMAFANSGSGWYSTLQGNNSDIQSGIIPNGVTLQYNTSASQWQFSYANTPAGGTSGYVLTKNSGSDYDYSWQPGGGTSTSQWTLTGNNLYPTTIGNNVGIGTTTPRQALDVNGTVSAIGGIYSGNVGIGTSVAGTNLFVNGTSTFLGSTNFFGTQISGISGNLNIVLSQNGIFTGYTTIPNLVGGASAASVLNIDSTLKGGGSNGDTINLNVGNIGNVPAVSIVDNIATSFNMGIGSTAPNSMLDVEGTINPVTFFAATPSSGSEQNVGIGTFQPGALLDVKGTVRLSGFKLTTTPSAGYVLTSSSTGIGTWQPSAGGGSGTVVSGVAGQSAYYPSSTTSVSGTNNMIISGTNTYFSQGNVGINSTVPAGLLDVEGTLSTAIFQGSSYNYQTNANIGIGTLSPMTSAIGVGTTSPRTGYVEINTGANDNVTQWSLAIIANQPGTGNQGSILLNNTNTKGYSEFDATNDTGSANHFAGWGIGGSAATLNPNGSYWYTGGLTNIALQTDYTQNTVPGIFISGDTAQNVGIGTSTPSQKFEVGLQSLDIMSNGNIGIGTIKPASQIQVVAATPTIQSVSNSSSSLGAVSVFNSASVGASLISTGSSYAIPNVIGILATTGKNFNFGSSGGSIFETIDQNGNVGIGSVNPNGILTIPSLKSTTGVRYLCISTTGVISSQAAACVGT